MNPPVQNSPLVEKQNRFYQNIVQGDFSAALNFGKKILEQSVQEGNQKNIAEAHLGLAHLFCHLGQFSESFPHYNSAYENFDEIKDHLAALTTCQNLGAALIEKGEYETAIQVLEGKAKKHLRVSSEMENMVHAMHLALAFIGIGSFPEAQKILKKVKKNINQESFKNLIPYYQLLEGRALLIQGEYTEAFSILREAGNQFSQMEDLAGEIEVLLALTAPLLEYQLFQEAQQLIQQISAREELKQYPALEHSMHLRRLALGAFMGKWIQSDLKLLQGEGMTQGRTEDWLQFWFHLSLAAARIGEKKLGELFLNRAKEIATHIEKKLTPKHALFFRRRPDISRLFRLSEVKKKKKARVTKPSHPTSDATAAEAGTLAPPTLIKS
jgi:tetratricopeptide (TPR) repeat protein